MPEIDGGYYIKARKIQESEIAFAPPHVREIWDWLIKEANHKDNGKFKRGQTMRSLKDVQDGLKWFIGYRKMTYSKSNCEMAMNWLRKRGMIETAKTTRGMIITIVNYDIYQNPKNYESNNEKCTKATINEQPSDTINKNDKNEKKENKTYDFDFVWNQYPNRIGRKQALRHFEASVKTDDDYTDIKRALENYKKSDKVARGFVQNGSTWFNNWQDWIPQEMQIQKPKTKAEIDALWGELAE